MSRFAILYRCNDSVVSVNGGSTARDCLAGGRSVSKSDCIRGCFLSLCKAIRASKYRDLVDLHIFYDNLSLDTRISMQRLARMHRIDASWHRSDNSKGIHQSFVDQLHESEKHWEDGVLLIEDDYLVEDFALDSLFELKVYNPEDEFAVNLLNEGVWKDDARDKNLLANTYANGFSYRTCCHSTCSFFLSKGRMARLVLEPSFDPKARSPERATVNPRLFGKYGWAPKTHAFHHMQCNVLNYPGAAEAKKRFAELLSCSERLEKDYLTSPNRAKDRYIVVSLRGAFIKSWIRSYIASGNTIPLIICTGPKGDWNDEDYAFCLKAAVHTGGFVHDCSYIWESCKSKEARGTKGRCGWYTKTAILHSIATKYAPKEWAWVDDDVEVSGDLSVVFDYAGTCDGFICTHFYNRSNDGKHPTLFQAGKVAWNSLSVFHNNANELFKVLENDFPDEDDELIFGHLYQNDSEWHDGFDDFPVEWQFICARKSSLKDIKPRHIAIHYTSHYPDGCKNYWRDKHKDMRPAPFEADRSCGGSHGSRAVLSCLTDGHIKPFLYWYVKSGSNIPLYIIKSNEWAPDKAAIAEAAVKRFGGNVLDYDDIWEYIKLVAPNVSHPAWGAKVMWWRKFIMSDLCPDTWMWLDSDVMVNQPLEKTFEWFEKHPDKFMGAQSRLGHKVGLFKGRDWFNNYNVFRDRTRCLELFNKIIRSQFERMHFDDENNLRHVLVTLKNDALLSGVVCMDNDISYDEPIFPGFYDHKHENYSAVHFGGGRAHSLFKQRYADIENKGDWL